MPVQSVEIRPATLDDLPGIHAVQSAAGRPGSPTTSLAGVIDDPNRCVLVAVRHAAVVGWAKTHYWNYSDGAAPAGHYLGGLAVPPIAGAKGSGPR